MTPKTGQSIVALLGVTALLGLGMLATNLFVDEVPAAGAAGAVAAMVTPGPTGSASGPQLAADSGGPCTLLTAGQVSGVTGGEATPVSSTGAGCHWSVSGSTQLADGTQVRVSTADDVTAEDFDTSAQEQVDQSGARRLKGPGDAAVLTGDGTLEVLSGTTTYRISLTVDGAPQSGQLVTRIERSLLTLCLKS
ncbi:hypothetical protein KIH74_22220 [Kineosporia sp. J2-2]|uniref:DUF3558 domain-containing protein n=1 Tax=Kineosporia corallincola TaxID=2835133 RepID=A0ABS5TKP0_9ACTN|nr:hypothetical protein [Kineosporia corallincola]MBT0771672.1 hypothetical protein [Kineosporia corallincola]